MKTPRYILAHSAKGTTWEKHDYIKVENGKYYYPDNYAGGRHLSNGDNQNQEKVQSVEPSGWETKLYDSFEESLRGENGKLDPKSVQNLLLFGKDANGKGYDNFKAALTRAGIDTSKIDERSLNLMRYKVIEHYKQEFANEKDNFDAEGNRVKEKDGSTKKSTKKSSKNKPSSKEETPTSKKEETSKSKTATGRGMHRALDVRNSSSYWTSSESDKDKYKTKNKKITHSAISIPQYVIKPVEFNPRHIFRG